MTAAPSPVLVVIPARWGSTRLPGKPLADIGGVPMVERVRRAVIAADVGRVIVATDDERIASVVADCGGEAVLTPPCATGTDRAASVAASLGWEGLVLVVQGDVPLVEPLAVRAIVDGLRFGASIATLATPLTGDPHDPNVVKVVCDHRGDALYFSRAPIPWRGPWLRHLGLYGFRATTLATITQVQRGDATIEVSEDLEQLRWLFLGHSIHVGFVASGPTGVDTPEQLDTVRRFVAAKDA